MNKEANAKQLEVAKERRTLLANVRLAEETGRWEDMVEYINLVVKLGRDLTVDERNLLADSYKHHVGTKRAAWRIITTIEQNIEGATRKRELSKEYRVRIEDEIRIACESLISLIDSYLLNTIDLESQIFYQKMKGDYYRYLAEFSRETASEHVFENAKVAYIKAHELCHENLSPAHPLSLAVVLNFSVFYYEILEEYETACDLVKGTLEVAKDDLHSISISQRNDSSLILQLLKDNLKIWSAEMDADLCPN